MMIKKAAVVLFAVGTIGHVHAQGNDSLARFEGGIGVIPVSTVSGPANPDGSFPNAKLNIVRGIFPGAGPWRIADLRAEVDTTGHIKVRGRGLLLASSNAFSHSRDASARLPSTACGPARKR